MKRKNLLLGFLIFCSNIVVAQSGLLLGGGAEITFEKEIHDFGTMKQYGDATIAFKFSNTGPEPLIISKSEGSCGCTVPQWPKHPIMPGKSDSIKVTYDSSRIGPFNKSVTIISNATNEATKVIKIKGLIEAAPKEEGFPAKEEQVSVPMN